MSKNLKTALILLVAVVLGGFSLRSFLSREDSRESEESYRSSGRRIKDADRKARSKRISERKASRAEKIATGQLTQPKFEIGSDEEEKLNALQRKLLEDIRAALRKDDYRTLMRLVHRMQASDEWPDGIPKSIKKAALEALGWYGSKCLPEIVNFLGDADSQIVAEATSQWEDAIAECDSDRDVAVQVKLAARVVNDADSMESIVVETLNMRHSVAVETFKEILANGNDLAYQKALEQIADYTNEEGITTADQLDAWLEENPDDPGDEEMYGGIDDSDADDD